MRVPLHSADPILDLGAAGLAARVRSGELTAVQVVEAHIERITATADLNAVVVPLFAEARAEAAAADMARADERPLGPLHGVPVTIKEQFLVAGTPTTFGLTWRRDHRATDDGPLVAALRSAGAIVLGKTNVSQILLYNESDNALYGRTLNPWSADRTPGGSSGGEAAVIAAGGSTLGLGGDLGGSVRAPAHFSGIAALKPTSLRLTRADTPDDINVPPPELPFQPGPMARTVADLHLLMAVLVRASSGAPDTTPDAGPYPEVLPDIRGLRVAVQIDEGPCHVSPAIRRAIQEATEDLVAGGATLVPFDPPPIAEAARLFLAVMAADGGAWLRAGLRDEPVDPRVAGLLQAGSIPNAARPIIASAMSLMGQRNLAFTVRAAKRARGAAFEGVKADLATYRAKYLAAMDAAGVDIVLSPPFAVPALRHGGSRLLHVANAGACSVLYNVVGLPAGAVPVTTVRPDEETDRPASRDPVERAALETERGSAGLPVGVQVAARAWREDLVLAGMAAIERGALRRIS